MRRSRAIVLSCLLLPTLACSADPVYVIDKLLVGIHRERDLNSPIIKVLPTGSQLQLLERKDQLARIKDVEGVEGWVDGAYLMKDPPAANQLVEVRQERQMLIERLKQMEARQAAGEATSTSGDGGKVDKLTNENTELKSQLSSLKLRGSELEQQLKSRGDSTGDGTVAGELRKANRELTQTVEQLRRRTVELEGELGSTGSGSPAARMIPGSLWTVFGLVVLALLSFGAGLYAMDYLYRRRHGGFRI